MFAGPRWPRSWFRPLEMSGPRRAGSRRWRSSGTATLPWVPDASATTTEPGPGGVGPSGPADRLDPDLADQAAIREHASTPDRRVRRGLAWSLVNSVSGRLLTVGVGMVLARLLTPAEYGAYAAAFLVLAITQSMNELGVSVALLRSPDDPTPLAPTAVSLSLGTSAALYLCVAALAPMLARTLGAPEVTTVIRLVSLNLLLDAISSVPNALLSRSFRQGRRALIDIGAFFPGAGVSIGLAAAGWGPSSLAWGSLAGNVTAVVLVYVLAPVRPLPGWNRQHARQLLHTGIPLAATSLVYLATLNVDYVVVGRMLGSEALGFYVLAFNLSSWPASLLSISIRRVAIPGFAQMTNDAAALGRAFARSVGLLAAVVVLTALLLSMLAEPLVTLFYGRTWLRAVDVLRWLAVLGGLRVLLDLGYDVLVALGSTRLLLVVQIVWLAALVVALPLGAAAGDIVGVGVGHVIVAAAVTGTAYLAALRRAGVPLRPVLAAFVGPGIAGAVTAGVLAAGLRLSWGPWTTLVGLSAGATVLYAAMLAIRTENRPLVRRVVNRLAGSFVRRDP
jgi:O-antigen/teichoic acid export membrane protein